MSSETLATVNLVSTSLLSLALAEALSEQRSLSLPEVSQVLVVFSKVLLQVSL